MRKQMLATIAVPATAAQPFPCRATMGDGDLAAFRHSSEDSGTSAYLGMDIADITSDRLGALKLKEEKGVEVTMVDPDAPQVKPALREHDVILTMNGTVIESKTQLHRMIRETPPGRIVTLGLSRDGQPMTIKVQLADRSKEWPHMEPMDDKGFHVQIPPIPTFHPSPTCRTWTFRTLE